MATSSFPFDSLSITNPDRAEPSATLAAYLATFFSDGVFTDDNQLAVRALDEPGLIISVDTGVGLIKGRRYSQDAPRTFSIAVGGTLARYDRVVLRMDLNQAYRNNDIYVVRGEEALNPIAPALTRNNVVYELSLATIYVPAECSAITAAQITDNRFDADLCGFVYVLLGSVDTSVISDQLQSYFTQFVATTDEWQDAQIADMEAFVETIKDKLSQADVGMLQLEIDAKQDLITTQQSSGALTVKTDVGFDMALYGFRATDVQFNADGSITESDLQGRKQVTSFASDGSITTDFYVNNVKRFTKTTTFNTDGSISTRIAAAE